MFSRTTASYLDYTANLANQIMVDFGRFLISRNALNLGQCIDMRRVVATVKGKKPNHGYIHE